MAMIEAPLTAEPLVDGAWQEGCLLLNFPSGFWTDDEFFAFCQANRELQIEQTATGRLVIMPPAGTESGGRNADITTDLTLWNRKTRLGKVIDSSGGFVLPDGAKCSPDASWIAKSRWEALDPADRKKFAHICPDFVVELRSETDRLPVLQEKMVAYLANGARLGWLVDPQNRCVGVYRPGQDVQVLENPASVSGDPELPGFVLDLQEIFA